MSYVASEIASEPLMWRQAAVLAREVGAQLPQRGERVAIVGCGTSYFVAQSAAVLREERGEGITDAFPASEMPLGRQYDRYIVITRSGATTEVLDMLHALPAHAKTIAITTALNLPVAKLVRNTIALPFADEQSVVQTRFATTALALLRAHFGADVEAAAADAERALAESLPVEPIAFDHFVFLGRGWAVGLAHEAALKMRETATAYAESYPLMEYRHGPIAVASERSLVWLLSPNDAELAREIRVTGAMVIEGTMDPMAELVQIQRLAVRLAESRGLDPDHPRHLNRAVVLS